MDTWENVDQELLLTARARIIACEIGEHEALLDDGALAARPTADDAPRDVVKA